MMYSVFFHVYWLLAEPKASWEHQSSSEQSDSDDSHSESIEEGSKSAANSKPQKRKKKEKKEKKRKPAIVYTDAQLTGLLKDTINKSKLILFRN